MIDCIITLDYEIYGNGEGSLKKLVYEPAERMKAIFYRWNARFVIFIEAAELEMIETNGTDQAIDLVKHQLRDFHNKGFELGLHLHPQWYNARYENDKWRLDYDEYNLCALSRDRIKKVVNRSIGYLRRLLGLEDFTPFSFRAGNWLFQPTGGLSRVLAECGTRVDTSVFKGGLLRHHRLDYRRALKNSYWWPFMDDVTKPDLQGNLVEFPVYTKMVPLWKLFTPKQIGIQGKGPQKFRAGKDWLFHHLYSMTLRYPQKFDFCRMTINQLKHTLDEEIKEDQKNPGLYRPIVAIGHTKDLIDYETVESLLCYLRRLGIGISTFREAYRKVKILREKADGRE